MIDELVKIIKAEIDKKLLKSEYRKIIKTSTADSRILNIDARSY